MSTCIFFLQKEFDLKHPVRVHHNFFYGICHNFAGASLSRFPFMLFCLAREREGETASGQHCIFRASSDLFLAKWTTDQVGRAPDFKTYHLDPVVWVQMFPAQRSFYEKVYFSIRQLWRPKIKLSLILRIKPHWWRYAPPNNHGHPWTLVVGI